MDGPTLLFMHKRIANKSETYEAHIGYRGRKAYQNMIACKNHGVLVAGHGENHETNSNILSQFPT